MPTCLESIVSLTLDAITEQPFISCTHGKHQSVANCMFSLDLEFNAHILQHAHAMRINIKASHRSPYSSLDRYHKWAWPTACDVIMLVVEVLLQRPSIYGVATCLASDPRSCGLAAHNAGGRVNETNLPCIVILLKIWGRRNSEGSVTASTVVA